MTPYQQSPPSSQSSSAIRRKTFQEKKAVFKKKWETLQVYLIECSGCRSFNLLEDEKCSECSL